MATAVMGCRWSHVLVQRGAAGSGETMTLLANQQLLHASGRCLGVSSFTIGLVVHSGADMCAVLMMPQDLSCMCAIAMLRSTTWCGSTRRALSSFGIWVC